MSLSDEIGDWKCACELLHANSVKERIQNTQRRIEEKIGVTDYEDDKDICVIIEEIFKEEFGDKLI